MAAMMLNSATSPPPAIIMENIVKTYGSGSTLPFMPLKASAWLSGQGRW